MARKVSIIIVLFSAFLVSGRCLFAQSSDLRNIETLILKDEYSQAARECKRILANHHRVAIRSKAHYLLGICHLKEARYAEARKNFNIILRRYQRSKFYDDANLAIADSYFLAGDFKQAKRIYEEFLSNFPRSQLISIARKRLEESAGAKPFANSYFSVQMGCFTNKKNAQSLRDKLIDEGHQAYILALPNDELYRVRIGKFSTRLQAESLEQRLRAEGYSTKVCP